MILNDDPQNDFSTIPFFDQLLNPNHPLEKLSRAIQWQHLSDCLGQFYNSDRGRPSNSLRAQAGTLMLKFIKNLSDRETVIFVQENIYAQRFCGLSPSQAQTYMHPASGLYQFREKIGPIGMAFIQEVLVHASKGKKFSKNGSLIIDTTCVPLDIHYPTDIRLLEVCRRNILSLFKKAKKWDLHIPYRTYSRSARKVFLQFVKLGKTKKETRKKVHKQMFQFVRRNFKQFIDLRDTATSQLGPLITKPNSPLHKFLITLKQTEMRVRKILHQQKLARQGILHIPNRIVSFHKDHVRPIARGKFPLDTEFGPKVLAAIFRKRFYLIGCFQNSVSDHTLLVPSLRWFKHTFGRLPKKLLADRGFFSRTRQHWIRSLGISSGIQPKGKNISLSYSQRQDIRLRLPIEAAISLAKRKFGWNRIRARSSHHESSWIALGAASLCVRKSFYLASSP